MTRQYCLQCAPRCPSAGSSWVGQVLWHNSVLQRSIVQIVRVRTVYMFVLVDANDARVLAAVIHCASSDKLTSTIQQP
jgi:hypothetical protein